jgi:hypothetical protein
MQCTWILWCETKTEAKARGVSARFIELTGIAVDGEVGCQPDPDIPGFDVHFRSKLRSTRWNDAIVELIGTGQKVADAWTLMGTVTGSLSACARQVKIPGIVLSEWTVDMPQADESVPSTQY